LISTILIWLYITALALTYGLVGDALLARFLTKTGTRAPCLVTGLLGISLLGWLLTLLSLVLPMAATSHALAVGTALVLMILLRLSIGLGVGFRGKDRLSIPFMGAVAVAASMLLILGPTVSFPDHYDSGLYHAQAIRWIDEYAAVRGIGNLHFRLAFNSSWHVLESFFGLSFLDPAGFRPLNGLLLLITTTAGLISIAEVARGNLRASRLMRAALFPLSIYYFQRHIASPLTDTPATLIPWLLWAAVLDYLERQDRARLDRESVALVVVAFFLVTVKLSALPAVLVALVALGRPWKWPLSPTVRLGVAAGIMLAPWGLRSMILSGTLAFPFSAFGPWPVEWAVSRDLIADVEAGTRAWARVHPRDAAEVLAMPASVWIPEWWASIGNQVQAALTLLILGPIIWLLLLPRSLELLRSSVGYWGSYLALVVVGYVGVVFWFASAPDFRFVLGTLVPLSLMLIIPLVLAAHRLARLAVQTMVTLALLLPVGGPLADGLESIAQPERIMKPAPYYAAQTRVVTTNGFPALSPLGTDQCWNAPLPCTPTLDPGLKLRGCTLDTGFRISSTIQEEQPIACAPLSSVQGRSRVPEILPSPRIERVIMRRRNQSTGPDIACDAERQNEIQALVRNRGAPATKASVTFELDETLVAQQLIATLDTDEERWVDAGTTLRPPRGDHVLIIRVSSPGQQTDDERRVDARCR
jgi:hypothetical protein